MIGAGTFSPNTTSQGQTASSDKVSTEHGTTGATPKLNKTNKFTAEVDAVPASDLESAAADSKILLPNGTGEFAKENLEIASSASKVPNNVVADIRATTPLAKPATEASSKTFETPADGETGEGSLVSPSPIAPIIPQVEFSENPDAASDETLALDLPEESVTTGAPTSDKLHSSSTMVNSEDLEVATLKESATTPAPPLPGEMPARISTNDTAIPKNVANSTTSQTAPNLPVQTLPNGLAKTAGSPQNLTPRADAENSSIIRGGTSKPDVSRAEAVIMTPKAQLPGPDSKAPQTTYLFASPTQPNGNLEAQTNNLLSEQGTLNIGRELSAVQFRDAPSGTALAQTVDRLPPAAAIVRQIAIVLPDVEGNRIEVRLDPPELGRVTLQMTITDDGITAAVTAERPEIIDILRRHADLLQKELQTAGHRNISMDFGQSSQGSSNQGHGNESPPAGSAAWQVKNTTDDTHPATDLPLELAGNRPLDLRL